MADVALKRATFAGIAKRTLSRGAVDWDRYVGSRSPIPLRELLPTQDDSAVVEAFLGGRGASV